MRLGVAPGVRGRAGARAACGRGARVVVVVVRGQVQVTCCCCWLVRLIGVDLLLAVGGAAAC